MPAFTTNPELGRLFTVQETAETFRVTERTIFNWLAQSRLPFVRIGGVTRIPEAEIAALVQRPSCQAVAR